MGSWNEFQLIWTLWYSLAVFCYRRVKENCQALIIHMKDIAMTKSGYDRIENDAYFTIEEWCTEALLETLGDRYPNTNTIWEPACGAGHMANVIKRYGYDVVCTDIKDWGCENLLAVEDFTQTDTARGEHIITNPPYEKKDAEAFVRHAVKMIADGKITSVAMLMRNEWDCASGRKDLFRDNPYFAAKITLLKRPRWFEKRENDSSPRHNYSWFWWSAGQALSNSGPRALYYDPKS